MLHFEMRVPSELGVPPEQARELFVMETLANASF
jgi:hypothetical protein